MPPNTPQPLKKRRPALTQTQMNVVEDRFRAERAKIDLQQFVGTRSLSHMESEAFSKQPRHSFMWTSSSHHSLSIRVDHTGINRLRNDVAVERILPNRPTPSVVVAAVVDDFADQSSDQSENVASSPDPFPSSISDDDDYYDDDDMSLTDCSESETIELLCVEKSVPKPDISFVCDDEMLQAKMNYWKENMNCIKNVVAPMVDQSELAFREFLRDNGADLAYSPMLHAHLFVNDFTYRKTSLATWRGEQNKFFIVQFCGNDPETLLTACRYVEGFCNGVDLNLGCPQLIAKRGNYGAYLQENKELICKMINDVHLHCKLPISAKIRVQDTVEETVDYALKLEAAGAAMITVHGRTREMKGINTGIADWSHIAEVKKALSVPVIANGNIQLPDDVDRCIAETGVDAVMSAEGILYNPLLFAGVFEVNHVVAQQYMDYARRFGANMSAVRAHLFRICHHSLLLHEDLRREMSLVSSMDEFAGIVAEIEKRAGITAEEYEAGMLAASKYAQFTDLRAFVESTPHWLSKPYVRPIQDDKKPSSTEYRANKKAEMMKLAEASGMSMRQIKKKERRRIDSIRVTNAKKAYPPCKRCGKPAGLHCKNSACRPCCRLACIVETLSCNTHKFSAEKMKAKRQLFLEKQQNTNCDDNTE